MIVTVHSLQLNLDPQRQGTFAKVAAGLELVRWFFKAEGTQEGSPNGLNIFSRNRLKRIIETNQGE